MKKHPLVAHPPSQAGLRSRMFCSDLDSGVLVGIGSRSERNLSQIEQVFLYLLTIITLK